MAGHRPPGLPDPAASYRGGRYRASSRPQPWRADRNPRTGRTTRQQAAGVSTLWESRASASQYRMMHDGAPLGCVCRAMRWLAESVCGTAQSPPGKHVRGARTSQLLTKAQIDGRVLQCLTDQVADSLGGRLGGFGLGIGELIRKVDLAAVGARPSWSRSSGRPSPLTPTNRSPGR